MLVASIVTYNSADVIDTVLNSLTRYPREDFQIYVVDNASVDDTVRIVEERYPSVNVIRLPKNVGFGAGHNTVIRRYPSDYHMMINPDIALDPEQIDKMIAYMDANPDVAILSPRIMNEDGTEQFLPKRYPRLRYLVGGRLESRGEPFYSWRSEYTLRESQIDKPTPVDFCTGCFLFCRSSMLKACGGFDERFFLHFEDADLTRGMQKYGRTMFVPDIHVTHKWNRENAKVGWIIRISVESMIKYMWKWRKGGSADRKPALWRRKRPERAGEGLKILAVCQYYYPEPFRVSDICEELVKRGHDVTVLTGLPNYPMGRIYDDYRMFKRRRELLHGVKVHRCFTVGRYNNVFCRFLNYASYMLSSGLYIRRLDTDYDLVFVNQLSPVVMASAGIRYKKRHQTKLVLYCQDLWPESLTAGGVSRSSLIYRIFKGISSNIYHQADEILVTSKQFSEYFLKMFGIGNTQYLPQYAEAVFTPEVCKKAPGETVDLMFAGNVGVVQSVDTIIRAAARTKDMPRLRWHIVGDGSELNNLKRLAGTLKADNVIFHGRRPLTEMPAYYAMADAMLVTMCNDETISYTLQGKVQSYMAAGKPILGACDGETRRTIEAAACGFCAAAEDVDGLIESVKRFMEADAAQLSANAYAYYERNFSEALYFEKLSAILGGIMTKGESEDAAHGA